MYMFGVPEVITLFLALIFCLGSLLFVRNRIRKTKAESGILLKKWPAIVSIIIGTILLITNVLLHLKFRADINNTTELLKPIAAMTSAPLFMFTIIGFMIGITLLLLGLMVIRRKTT